MVPNIDIVPCFIVTYYICKCWRFHKNKGEQKPDKETMAFNKDKVIFPSCFIMPDVPYLYLKMPKSSGNSIKSSKRFLIIANILTKLIATMTTHLK